MSLSDRRTFVTGLAALAGLSACRLQPAYGTDGAARAFYGRIETTEPGFAEAYVLNRRIEERLGRGGPAAPLVLDVDLKIESEGLGTDRDGSNQRVHVTGEARYRLSRRGETGALAQGIVRQFTGYSPTGNTVATRAARGAARERLAAILADAVVERLLLAAPDLPL